MGVWMAIERTTAANVFMNPGDKIQLTDEWEKELKLGKYAADGKDEKGRTIKTGHKWLRQVSKEKLAADDPNAPDGFIYMPIENNTQPKEYSDAGIRPTRFTKSMTGSI